MISMPGSSTLVQAIGWAPGRPLSRYVGVMGLFAKISVQGLCQNE